VARRVRSAGYAAGRIAAASLLATLVLTGCRQVTTAHAPADRPVVEVAAVQQRDVPIYHEWIATLAGDNDAVIHAQVAGYLVAQDYREGQFVRKNDVLFRIDPKPFEAAVRQAEGTLARDKALARSAEIEYRRVSALYEKKNASQNEFDQARAAFDAAAASVDINAAALDRIRIDLSYCTIRAPADGIAGLADAQIGNLVSSSSPPLTAVSTVDPIKATFIVSEQEYLAFRRQFPEQSAYQALGHLADLQLILADGSVHPQPGRFLAGQRQVDPQTGTMQVEATFANPGNVLRPGQFGHVRALVSLRAGALLVPQPAVIELQDARQVIVVGPDNVAHVRTVKVGPRVGRDWLIESGLAAGERVVVHGVQKARDGTVVAPTTWPEEK
jgi:membrane fusion protein (multidrug efflux system)